MPEGRSIWSFFICLLSTNKLSAALRDDFREEQGTHTKQDPTGDEDGKEDFAMSSKQNTGSMVIEQVVPNRRSKRGAAEA